MTTKISSLVSTVLLLFTIALIGVEGHSQVVSVNGGSIQGTITDSTGAILPGASVTILATDTQQTRTLTTDSAGFYSVGPLVPGPYRITVTMNGFTTLTVDTVVRTGTATSGNFRMVVGSSTTTVEVSAGSLQVNTEQIGVSDVINKEQIDSLPVNGRNFLDLAQIEPGVILQSGESFDPTKAGYSALSVSGVSGRTTRILLDGQDVTDETVGTTIFNVSQGAIGDFQLNRATQDVSGDVTSTGQVLVSTNSGTNAFHGMAFYDFQDHSVGFARTVGGLDSPFQRNQFGGSVGGPILKDKLFFFANVERIKQESPKSIQMTSTFAAIQAKYPVIPSPYRQTYSTLRLDYNGPHTMHFFGRVNYNVDLSSSNFGQGYEIYNNRDNTPGYAGGMDLALGHFTHSFRVSYEKFHNLLVDGIAGNPSVYYGFPGLNFRLTADGLFSGPNVDAPQNTYQSDKQFRYDGSWLKGRHNIRYGYSLNRILGGGFASFFGLAPRASISKATLFSGVVSSTNPNGLGCGGVAGVAACPARSSERLLYLRCTVGQWRGILYRESWLRSCRRRRRGLASGRLYCRQLEGNAQLHADCRCALERRYGPRQPGPGNAAVLGRNSNSVSVLWQHSAAQRDRSIAGCEGASAVCELRAADRVCLQPWRSQDGGACSIRHLL